MESIEWKPEWKIKKEYREELIAKASAALKFAHHGDDHRMGAIWRKYFGDEMRGYAQPFAPKVLDSWFQNEALEGMLKMLGKSINK
jgi:hypothetical protein